jgi:DNA-binding MarR family transcriptional regulator
MASTSKRESPATAALVADLIAIYGFLMKHSSAPIVEFAEQHDLSFTQLKVMFILTAADDPLSIGRIGERTGGSLPATGRAVDGLVKHGLVDRSEDPDDRRVKLVAITPLGSDAMGQILESRAATLHAILGELPSDQIVALESAIAPLSALMQGNECRQESK